MYGLPAQISRYRVRSVLGVGGFGVVVLAFDEGLDANVAIKILTPEHALDAGVRERFVREAQLLRRVRSSHVIAVHDIGELDDGRPYFVMELAGGGVLSDRIDPAHAVEAQGVRATVIALAGGLGALHAAGIIHRDVKPGNLLVVDDSRAAADASATMQRQGLLAEGERIVVGDLGLAKDQERTAHGATIVGGTLHFRSPEQVRRGAVIGPTADVYAATAVIWNLLTGEEPEAGPELEAQLATVASPWKRVLARGFAPEPEERFGTMAEWEAAFLDALDDAQGTRTVGFRSVAPGTTCPYKGLASFQPEDASFFFGRTALIGELVRRLSASRTLVIGGPSGGGKSSLMRAGLIPALAAGALPGSQHWTTLLFSPGDDALGELAHQLGRLAPDRPPPTAADLGTGAHVARRYVPAGTAAVLAIDQFEELFTQNPDTPARQTFLDTLASLAASSEATIRIVIALRSDYYSTAALYPWLAGRISENQVLVGPMQRHELRQAIEEPAERAGLRLEPGLAEAFLDDAGDEAGALPLVAHALMETWSRRRGTLLTVDAFRAAGGVVGAIAQSAEHAYERLDPDGKIAARRLFLRLVTPGDNAPDARRRLAWDELEADALTHAVIEALANARLLTVDDRGVEIVHETLIGTWPRFRAWIEESRDALRNRQRITQVASEWNTQGRDPDLFYRGAPLAAALEWSERADIGLGDLATEFLVASRDARDAEETAALAAEQRRRRVRRIAFSTLSVLAVAAVAASIVAFAALGRSQDKEAEAEQRFAHALATQAESLATTQPKLALALATESAARATPISAEAQRAIVSARQTLSSSRIVPDGEPIPVGDVLTTVVTPDGSTIVTGARDGTVRLWDTKTGDNTRTLTGLDGGVEEAVVSPNGRTLVAVGAGRAARGAGAGGGAWRWDLHSGSEEGSLIARSSTALWSAAFSTDGARLATAAEDGAVQIYDTSSWAPIGDPLKANADALSVAFTLDGTRLLAGTGDGRVFIWDVASHELIRQPIRAHGTNDVWEIVMHPDGKRFATGSSDGTARVWSLATGGLVASPFPVADRTRDSVSGLEWSADGTVLYAGGSDGRVRSWDLALRREGEVSTIGHDDAVEDASMSRDGKVLVTLGHQDVRVWDLGRREPEWTTIADLGDEKLYGLAVSADGRTVATSDGHGVLRVYSLGRGELINELHAGDTRVFGLAFLPNGRLVSGDDEGTLRLWDVKSRVPVATREHAAEGAITSVAVSPRGDLASAGSDGVVSVWSARDLSKPVASTARVPTNVNDVLFTRSGELVTANGDGKVRFWRQDGTESRPPLAVDPDGDVVFSVAVSPDETELAAATATDDVTLWDLDARRLRAELNGQPADPLTVAFTRDGDALATANRQGIVTLWNAQTGESIGHRFDNHGSKAVWRVDSAAHNVIISAGEDGTLTTLDALDIDRACRLGAGSFDRLARSRYLGDRKPEGCVE